MTVSPTFARIALVTGGSRGIGKNIALSLAARGIDVIVTYLQAADEARDVVAQVEEAGRKAARFSWTSERLPPLKRSPGV